MVLPLTSVFLTKSLYIIVLHYSLCLTSHCSLGPFNKCCAYSCLLFIHFLNFLLQETLMVPLPAFCGENKFAIPTVTNSFSSHEKDQKLKLDSISHTPFCICSGKTIQKLQVGRSRDETAWLILHMLNFSKA